VSDTRAFALNDGHCPGSFKLLIALALDASEGAIEGVRGLAEQALQAGATKEEIAEAVRVAQYICGVGCAYTRPVPSRTYSEPFFCPKEDSHRRRGRRELMRRGSVS